MSDLLNRQRLIFNQKAKLIEMNIDFAIRDENGERSAGSAWNFSIMDAAGTEDARITKTWEGLAKTLFTTADDYLLDVSGPDLSTTMRRLILASAAGVDLALKQDSRGLS
ncbi:MAG TPA: phospholipid scramblase-related protein [Actinomycetota bacterium]